MTVRGPYEYPKYYIGLSTDTKPLLLLNPGDEFFETDTRTRYIWGGSAWTIKVGVGTTTAMTTATDPALNAATTTAIIDAYGGTLVTLTGAGNSQTISDPTITTAGKIFTVVNNDTSTDPLTIVANSVSYAIDPGMSQSFIWDTTAWNAISIGITEIPVPVIQGGTGSTIGALTASGNVSGGLESLTVATSANLTAQQCRGVAINNYDQGAAITPVFPTCAAGLHGKLCVVTVGFAIHLDVQAADISYLDGVLLDAGDKISNASPVMDDELYFEAVLKTGGGYRWKFTSGQGLWIDGGA